MAKKPKITYEPSEKLKKRRKERRGTVKEKAEKVGREEHEGGKRDRREGDGRRYTADRCSDDIPVKGGRLYAGIIADTKSDDLFSILKYREE